MCKITRSSEVREFYSFIFLRWVNVGIPNEVWDLLTYLGYWYRDLLCKEDIN